MRSIWIELPATDIDRGRLFYAHVFGHEPTEVQLIESRAITVIPGEPIVSLTRSAGFEPGTAGPLPYFDVSEPLSAVVERVLEHGGSVIEQITERPGYGFFSLVLDSEGNHIYVHSADR